MKCPHCGNDNKITAGKEGTSSTICDYCNRSFNYVVTGGKLVEWEPPRVIGLVYKGAGNPGGKG